MHTATDKKQKSPTRMPLLILGIGLLVMMFKIYADSEPGALPLLFVLVGLVWYITQRIQLRSKNQRI